MTLNTVAVGKVNKMNDEHTIYEIEEEDVDYLIPILAELFCEGKISDKEYLNLIMSL